MKNNLKVKHTDINEGILSRAADTVYAFRFVRLLVQNGKILMRLN